MKFIIDTINKNKVFKFVIMIKNLEDNVYSNIGRKIFINWYKKMRNDIYLLFNLKEILFIFFCKIYSEV